MSSRTVDTGDAVPAAAPSRRARTWRAVFLVVVLGLAVHLLLPQVDELDKTVRSLERASPVFIALALAASAISYVGSAISLAAASTRPLPFGRAAQACIAASALQAVTPANIGTYALYGSVLRGVGASTGAATSSVALHALTPIVVGTLFLVLSAPLVGGEIPRPELGLPRHLGLTTVVLVLLVLAGILAVAWWCHRRKGGLHAIAARVGDSIRAAYQELREVTTEPRRAALLFGGATLLTVAYIAGLYVSILAFGGRIDLITATFVFTVATAVAAIAPTPGGIGAVEAAMVSGLTLLGVASGPAVAGVLLYRLVTFWVPIPIGVVALRGLHKRGIGATASPAPPDVRSLGPTESVTDFSTSGDHVRMRWGRRGALTAAVVVVLAAGGVLIGARLSARHSLGRRAHPAIPSGRPAGAAP